MEERTLDIPLQRVESRQIHAIGYHPETNTLRVQFKAKDGPGSTYDYPGVPADKHADFVKADSIGKFFGAHIKGKFDFRKLPAAKKAEPAKA